MEDRKAITDSGYLCPDEPIPEVIMLRIIN